MFTFFRQLFFLLIFFPIKPMLMERVMPGQAALSGHPQEQSIQYRQKVLQDLQALGTPNRNPSLKDEEWLGQVQAIDATLYNQLVALKEQKVKEGLPQFGRMWQYPEVESLFNQRVYSLQEEISRQGQLESLKKAKQENHLDAPQVVEFAENRIRRLKELSASNKATKTWLDEIKEIDHELYSKLKQLPRDLSCGDKVCDFFYTNYATSRECCLCCFCWSKPEGTIRDQDVETAFVNRIKDLESLLVRQKEIDFKIQRSKKELENLKVLPALTLQSKDQWISQIQSSAPSIMPLVNVHLNHLNAILNEAKNGPGREKFYAEQINAGVAFLQNDVAIHIRVLEDEIKKLESDLEATVAKDLRGAVRQIHH